MIEVYMGSGVGYSIPGSVADVINNVLSLFTKYRTDRVGTLLKGPIVSIVQWQHAGSRWMRNFQEWRGGLLQ